VVGYLFMALNLESSCAETVQTSQVEYTWEEASWQESSQQPQ
jgi:hypothetical protein